jgi:uncharacterized membrane protein YbhN (UPF0104 family)
MTPGPVASPSILARVFRGAARLFPLALAALLLFAFRERLPAVLRALAHAHPVALVVLPLFFVWNQIATIAWRLLLRATGVITPPLRELVRLRIEAQAVNQLVPSGGVAGEALRAVRAGGKEGWSPAALATALDNVAATIAGLAFALPLGIVALAFRRDPSRDGAVTGLVAVSCSLVLLIGAIFVPFRFAPAWLSRLAPNSPTRKLLVPFAARTSEVRRAFRDALGLRFVERVVGLFETYVVFRAVDAPISIGGAALVSAVLVIVSFTVFFVPGQLGAAEAATAAAAGLLGIPVELGLSASLLRRARQLAVCLLGVVSLCLRGRQPWGAARAAAGTAGTGDVP